MGQQTQMQIPAYNTAEELNLAYSCGEISRNDLVIYRGIILCVIVGEFSGVDGGKRPLLLALRTVAYAGPQFV